MKKIGIFVNRERDPQLSAAINAATALIKRGATVLFDEAYKAEILDIDAAFVSHEEMMQASDLIITLGGDGTILKVISDAAKYDTPVVGINLGHLGFLTQAEHDDEKFFDQIVNGDFSVNHFMALKAQIFKNGQASDISALALNDIIFRGDGTKMISLEVEVDGTVTNRYLADGIIVATSTGSTAYSLSCGGPIVHQSLDCMILTPVCPHTLKSRCIIVPPNSRIILRFDASYCSEAEVKADGIPLGALTDGDYIEIVKSDKSAPLIMLDGFNYFDVIRKKLSD